jgi:flagellar biosynthesis chaperone FliJ
MEPEPFGLAHIYQCIPYANPKLFRRDFEGAVQRGWLTISAEGAYRATDQGLQFHYRLQRELQKIYNQLHPLPMMQLERIETILGEIIKAIEISQKINYKPAFEMDLRLVPTKGSTLQNICCQLSHLMAYRDDSYINAWMEKEINSYVWEAFSFIFKGQAQTAAALAQNLKDQRQYDEAIYMQAINELEARGWITGYSEHYEPTSEGLSTLAEVARTMTQFFFEPWAALEESKIHQLQILMEALLKGLKSPQTKRWHGQTSTSRHFGWRSAQWVRDKVR